MQPLDINKIDAKIIAAAKNRDTQDLLSALYEISNRILQAINPISSISAPLVVMALKVNAKAITDQLPGADKTANMYAQLFGYASIQTPVPQKTNPRSRESPP